ncbi:MAG: hypothetical protein HY898_29235, partial [Deltaproteobacteria bacterium]|nr:hypothetical protein [Deltaproteobacteria bacterium]
MTYQIISPPFSLKFWEMSEPELRKYYQWFMKALPERIKVLESAVQETEQYSLWSANETPDSLSSLGEWFTQNVEVRPRTQEEMWMLNERQPYTIEVAPVQLTDRTLSLSIDVGMYFSQVLLRNVSGTFWEQPMDSKSIDYGQPVLNGFSGAFFNPVQVATNVAYGVSRGKRNDRRLSTPPLKFGDVSDYAASARVLASRSLILDSSRPRSRRVNFHWNGRAA